MREGAEARLETARVISTRIATIAEGPSAPR
jgi:hypothetical protein